MKRAKSRKILSIILVIVMVTSLCGYYVQAEDNSGNAPEIVTESPTPPSKEDAAVISEEDPDADSEENPDAISEENPDADSEEDPDADSEEDLDADSEEDPDADSEDNPDTISEENPDAISEDKNGNEDSKVSESDTPELISQTLNQKMSDGVTVEVSGNLPRGVKLVAEIVDASVDDFEVLYAYDITLWLDGEEYTITEEVTVCFIGVVIPEAENIEAYHIDDNKNVEPIGVDADAKTGIATMTAESFSKYLIGIPAEYGAPSSEYTIAIGETLNLESSKKLSGTWSIVSGTGGIALSKELSGNASEGKKATCTVTAVAEGDACVTYTYAKGSHVKADTFHITVDDELFNVSYNANGGTGDIPLDTKSYASGNTVTVLPSSLTNGDATFLGWSTTMKNVLQSTIEGGDFSYYNAGSTFTITKDTSLFAVWFDGSCYYDSGYELRWGYDTGSPSDGISSVKTGVSTILYESNVGTKVTVGTAVSAGSIIVTASEGYTIIGYRIVCSNKNSQPRDCKTVPSSFVVSVPNTNALTIPVGIYSFSHTSKSAPYYVLLKTRQDCTTYHVSYELGTAGSDPVTGTTPVDSTKYARNAPVTVKPCPDGSSITVPNGYIFDGWLLEGTSTKYASGAVFPITQNSSLIAQWKTADYTVTYKAAANTSLTTDTVYHNVAHNSPVPPAPSINANTGYTLVIYFHGARKTVSFISRSW